MRPNPTFRPFRLHGKEITRRQAEQLARHSAGAQPVDVRLPGHSRTVRSLLALQLLRFRSMARRETVLTAEGRPYAGRALAVAADAQELESC